MFYEGLYLYKKTGVDTARTLKKQVFTKMMSCLIIRNVQIYAYFVGPYFYCFLYEGTSKSTLLMAMSDMT